MVCFSLLLDQSMNLKLAVKACLVSLVLFLKDLTMKFVSSLSGTGNGLVAVEGNVFAALR